MKWIWIKNKRFYYYDSFNDYNEARRWALSHKKKNGAKYFILKYDTMGINPFRKVKYALYLDKMIGLW